MDGIDNTIQQMLEQNEKAFTEIGLDQLVQVKEAHKKIKTEIIGLMVNLLSTQTDVRGRLVNPMPGKEFDYTIKLANTYLNGFINDYFDVHNNDEMELNEENVDESEDTDSQERIIQNPS